MPAPTEQSIEGPFYRAGAPVLVSPRGGSLVRREAERGAVLILSGDVRSTAGGPLPGAVVDLWQASAEGLYSPGSGPRDDSSLFDHRQPPFNLRGRITVGPDGGFEVRSVVPGAYRDPPGSLAEDSIRPAHLHARVSHPGHAPLTTQIFFEDDPHLQSDPAEAVRPGLVCRLERRADPADLGQRGLVRAYFACWFGFVLAPGS